MIVILTLKLYRLDKYNKIYINIKHSKFNNSCRAEANTVIKRNISRSA